MTDQPIGPRCGNNPNVQLTEGDRRAVDEFRAFLEDRAALRDLIAEALYDARKGGLGGMSESAAVTYMANAVLKALPAPADTAAVLNQAADTLDARAAAAADVSDNPAAFVAKARSQTARVWREAARQVRRMADEARGNDKQDDGAWLPCSPAWLAANPGQCGTAPRVPGPEGTSHLHPATPAEDPAERRERYAVAIHDAMEADLSLVDQEPSVQALFARAAEVAVALAAADRAAACICGHTEPQHFEDACLVCDCADYLTPGAAREVIARYQAAVKRESEDPARIDRIRPEFTEHSSVEAIDAQLQRARAQERRWHLRAEWLISLRQTRVGQKARGEWPAAEAQQDGAQDRG